MQIYGKFSCYACFFVLPSDKEANRYLRDFGKELHLISDNNCLILAFSKSLEMDSGFDEGLWKAITSEHIQEGYSIEFAQYLSISLMKFPCLVIFDDIRSSDHILVDLKSMTAEDIAERMRLVFSVISKAVSTKTNPLQEMRNVQVKEGLNKKGQVIFGELRSLAGKTIETAIEALINASTK